MRSIHAVSFTLSAVLALLSERPAAAQSSDAPATHGARFRFGAGVVSGLVVVPYGSYSDSVATLFGLSVRLGAQLSDRLAITYQASATALWPQIRNGVLFEWTPSDYFTLGAGPAVDVLASVPNGAGSTDGTLAVGGDVRLAWNIPLHRAASGRRYAVSVSVDLTSAYASALRQGSATSGFQFGVMGGVGFEMY